MSEVADIAGRLSEAQRRAVVRQGLPKVIRAGDLFPGRGQEMAATWLKETPLFERYYHTGYMAYSLTLLGLQVRAHLTNKGEG